VRLQGLRRHLVDVDDAAVVGDERDGQRQQRVLHPEALLGRLFEDEQHALVLGHFLAVHQSGHALLGRRGDLGVDLVHADRELHARQLHLGLVLRHGHGGGEGEGEGKRLVHRSYCAGRNEMPAVGFPVTKAHRRRLTLRTALRVSTHERRGSQ
jgi:hypothetical protein